jgi:threonine dehydratase
LSRVPVTPDDIDAAAARLSSYVRRTPVIEHDEVVLKLEFLQHTASFKARGAFNRVLCADVPPTGVIAASGGNHGAATAYVAQRLGLRAEIFVPSSSPASKVERIRSLGATVIVGGDYYDDAQRACNERQRETGALLVHPYDHVHTVAGAGTVGREFEQDAPDLDTVLVAVGGGGLCAGVAAWYAGRLKVVAVEPELLPAMHDSLAAGEPVEITLQPSIAADSLGARRIGAVPFAVAREYVSDAVLVADDDIRAAQRRLWDELRILCEPGGAAAYAAITAGAYRPGPEERVGVVLCGANLDPWTVLGQSTT